MRSRELLRLSIFALAALPACTSSAPACPDDKRVHFSPDVTLASLCANNGHTIIVRFREPQTVETVLPLLQPLGATLACDDPTALMGQPGKTCYFVRLGRDRCCGVGMAYFDGLGSPAASTDVPRPETPCSCETNWDIQMQP